MTDLAASIFADLDHKAQQIKGADPDTFTEYATDALHDAVEYVVRLHLRYERDGKARCGHCKQPWPCKTVDTIAGHLGIEVAE